MENKNKNLIIEDVIYIEETVKNGIPFYKNIAKGTFFYQFLMENAEDSISGQNNRKAATDFYNFEEIYCYLLNQGYIQDKKYSLDCSFVDSHCFFTLNLSKLLEDVNLEEELNKHFDGQCMSEYIYTFCHPSDSLRCSFCGSISYSRHISFIDENKKCTYCLSCHPLEVENLHIISNELKANGVLPAVKKRLKIIEEKSKVKIPEGKTINSILDQYMYEVEDNKDEIISDDVKKQVQIINSIIERNNLEFLEVFSSCDFDIVIWNRKALANIDIFTQAVALSDDGEIITLFNVPDVVYLEDKAIEYILEFTTNEEEISTLKSNLS